MDYVIYFLGAAFREYKGAQRLASLVLRLDYIGSAHEEDRVQNGGDGVVQVGGVDPQLGQVHVSSVRHTINYADSSSPVLCSSTHEVRFRLFQHDSWRRFSSGAPLRRALSSTVWQIAER
eukprot:CAMPEP_0173222510 /NCGR_PEP_ID=MMETSP1142-20121109/3297_1 /TAXON_ID=483371 /ORGANISM="non described non described, Strain CCMP2298" /LENGTH=119 /DNA_ID=CAMNT_0014150621 /DNA_START=615 /DNA_END=971 /DNA_ORIENTATION=+